MAEFIIVVPEVRWARYYTDAESQEEALAKYKDGDAVYDGDEDTIEVSGPSKEKPWYINNEKYHGEGT